MAVPEQQFQSILDQIEQTVKDTIAANLPQAPAQLPPLFDLDEFREQLLTAVRDELRVFKEELLAELEEKLLKVRQPAAQGNQQPTPPESLKDRLKKYW